MIFTSSSDYKGQLVKVDISTSTKSKRCKKIMCSKNYRQKLKRSKVVLDQLAEVAKSSSVAIICDCHSIDCCRFELAEYLVNNYNCQYEGEVGVNDENLLQNIDRLELDPNVVSFLYEKSDMSEEQIKQTISDIWKTEERTMSDCLKEYEETVDSYKQSLDIVTPQALIDMACMEKGYQNLRYEAIKECRDKCCVQNGEKVANAVAGKMDITHFNEMCVAHRGRLYRLEEKSGKVAKHQDIEWIANQINCTLQEADLFNKAFKDLNLRSKEIYQIIFGHSIGGKKSGIKGTGNKFLQQFLDLQAEVNKFKLEDNHQQYSEIENIDEDYNSEIDLTEVNFSGESDERYDSELYTAKRLSIDEESISEEEIVKIKYGTYEDYKEVLKKYMEPAYRQVGKGKYQIIGKKVNQTMISSAVSMAWIYLKEAKERHKRDREKVINQTIDKMPDYFKDAIDQYRSNPSRTNRYRITTLVHGGEWEGITHPPATPEEKMVCWSVIYK